MQVAYVWACRTTSFGITPLRSISVFGTGFIECEAVPLVTRTDGKLYEGRAGEALSSGEVDSNNAGVQHDEPLECFVEPAITSCQVIICTSSKWGMNGDDEPFRDFKRGCTVARTPPTSDIPNSRNADIIVRIDGGDNHNVMVLCCGISPRKRVEPPFSLPPRGYTDCRASHSVCLHPPSPPKTVI